MRTATEAQTLTTRPCLRRNREQLHERDARARDDEARPGVCEEGALGGEVVARDGAGVFEGEGDIGKAG